MKIATLGPKGTYSEQAVIAYARRCGYKKYDIIFTPVDKALYLIEKREADMALIPVENMVDGLIGPTLDALIDYHDFVKAYDEIHIAIKHVLVAKKHLPLNEIKIIYSHGSALNQCSSTLQEKAPRAELVVVNSTSEAAEIVCNSDKPVAAVCSSKIIETYPLEIICDDIQDYKVNQTRFLVCSLTDGAPTGNDRTLLAIRYGIDMPGQLFHTLHFFNENNINLSFIQSRPYKIRPQEYVMILEIMGHKNEPRVEVALRGIEKQVRATNGWKKILGSYPCRNNEEAFSC
ncbi:MAG: prephenate dehydratase [Bacillota bacterium]